MEVLSSLEPGGELDLRGTSLAADRLRLILSAMRDPENGRPRIGNAQFDSATFMDDSSFKGAVFSDRTSFDDATFTEDVSFEGATFGHYTAFHNAIFKGWADFYKAKFKQVTFARSDFVSANFEDVVFDGWLTEFNYVSFSAGVSFTRAAAKGEMRFLQAKFSVDTNFRRMTFDDLVSFGHAIFNDDAHFEDTVFGGRAEFGYVRFPEEAWFYKAQFKDWADFGETNFTGHAWFQKSIFTKRTFFENAKVSGNASFIDAKFLDHAGFTSAHVSGRLWMDSLSSGGELVLDDFRADSAVEVIGKWKKVKCSGAEFRGRVWFRLSGGELWLDDSAFAGPVTVESALDSSPGKPGSPAGTRVLLRSLKGTDAEHLTLVDVDLGRCEMAGLRRPELMRLEGRCVFAPMPRGWCLRWRWLPWRWTAREALFEEHLWRRTTGAPTPRAGWAAPDPDEEIVVVGPDRLAVMYRQVRAVLEDAKNEPGAADLYYGEMEMRRAAARREAGWGERRLLGGYWMVSGYGLRASRSLAGLAALIVVAAAVLTLVGFSGATAGFGQCVLYAAGSVVSLDLGHVPSMLTDWGDVVRLVLRIGGPLLLGLAALAVRGRVKR
jgi:uncharacterized protein YjbI with pentapeptide repeats